MTIALEYPEGATPLDPDEIEGLIHQHVTTTAELNHLEQANIADGLQWIAGRQDIEVLTEKFVRELHRKLFGQVWEWAGRYRKSKKNIGVDPLQITIQLRLLLDDVRYWIEQKTYDPQEIALRFHHRLVHIHLFPNGNGRHARIMADTLLTRALGTDPIDWTGGHGPKTMSIRREEYISALREADKGDYGPLLCFIGIR
jgi:Fic-DOC domain mobile mystery protein B